MCVEQFWVAGYFDGAWAIRFGLSLCLIGWRSERSGTADCLFPAVLRRRFPSWKFAEGFISGSFMDAAAGLAGSVHIRLSSHVWQPHGNHGMRGDSDHQIFVPLSKPAGLCARAP